jgi:23S rRNA (uracil1939-C5)-methyltransferase
MQDPAEKTAVSAGMDERVHCVHADRCSGCPLIDLSYAEQLEYKRDRLAKTVELYPSLGAAKIDLPPPAEPRTGYRTRAKLMVAPGPRIGLFAKGGGHVVVDIPECKVLSPALLEVVARLRDLLQSPPPAARGALVASEPGTAGALAAFDLREVNDEAAARVLVSLVIDVERRPSNDALAAAATAVQAADRRIVGVAASFRREDSPQVLGPETLVLSGPAATSDSLAATSVHHMATYGSFAQAHRTEAARIRETVRQQIAARTGTLAGKRILDLYGGSGTTALLFAQSGAFTTLVESFAPAAESARRAAEGQGLAGIEVRIGDATRITQQLVRDGARFDAVIANPPRRGIDPLGRQAIADLAPAVVAYVSCDPDTLARDLDHFARLGLRADSVRVFDLLPMTDHVETVAVLLPGEAAAIRVAYEDDEVAIVEKAPDELVSGPGPVTLLGRASTLPGFGAAASVSSLPFAASGLVALVKAPALVGAFASAMRAPNARRIYLLGVRGIAARTGAISSGKMRSRYRRIGVAAGHSVVSVASHEQHFFDLLRGFARIGHHVLGDRRFGHGPTNRHFDEKYGLCRLFLHCARIEFRHPRTDALVVVDSPWPGDLAATLGRMGADPALFLAPGTKIRPEHAPASD